MVEPRACIADGHPGAPRHGCNGRDHRVDCACAAEAGCGVGGGAEGSGWLSCTLALAPIPAILRAGMSDSRAFFGAGDEDLLADLEDTGDYFQRCVHMRDLSELVRDLEQA